MKEPSKKKTSVHRARNEDTPMQARQDEPSIVNTKTTNRKTPNKTITNDNKRETEKEERHSFIFLS